MPRKHKNKNHAHGKRYQVQGDTQEAQASAAAAPGEECLSSPSFVPQVSSQSSVAAGNHQELQGAMAPSSTVAEASCAGSEEGTQGPKEESADAAQAALVTRSIRKDTLIKKASMVMDFLLERYIMKEPITQDAMLEVIGSKFKQHFPEILSRASERVELLFGLELKEVDCSRNIYTLVNKFSLGVEEGSSDEEELPKSGLLMALLGIIFMKGNRATEEEIWEFLNVLGIHAGKKHSIFGEPRKLITKDLVQKGYLNYRQVPNSDPPGYEFLWGPRAYAETTKMKVLEVLAKIQETVPSSFPDLYDEALRDQVERAGLRGAARAPAMAEASASTRAKSYSSSHI
ncbi:melanoma-associated antigen B4-like [Bos indicus]|uniref:Melanoma-associated antigen B4-like n=1 Tax=Bos indicus TaxID=9915 RepID=A0ABM4RVZ2_BOSIN|nr:melanoma-associated antigen B4-like [Bos indicus x Bos taurus]